MGLAIRVIKFEDTPPNISEVIALIIAVTGLEIEKSDSDSNSIIFSNYPNEAVTYKVNSKDFTFPKSSPKYSYNQGNHVALTTFFSGISYLLYDLITVALASKGGVASHNPQLNENNYKFWRSVGKNEIRYLRWKNKLGSKLIDFAFFHLVKLVLFGISLYWVITWLIR